MIFISKKQLEEEIEKRAQQRYVEMRREQELDDRYWQMDRRLDNLQFAIDEMRIKFDPDYQKKSMMACKGQMRGE